MDKQVETCSDKMLLSLLHVLLPLHFCFAPSREQL